MAKHSISSGRRPCRPSWAKEHPNSHENFTCVAEDFLNGERMKSTIWPAGTPAATIKTPDGLILSPMSSSQGEGLTFPKIRQEFGNFINSAFQLCKSREFRSNRVMRLTGQPARILLRVQMRAKPVIPGVNAARPGIEPTRARE